MRARDQHRLLQGLGRLRALQKDHAAGLLAAARAEVERANEEFSSASAKLKAASVEWEALLERPVLDLQLSRASSSWVVERSRDVRERERGSAAALGHEQEQRARFNAALARREVAGALEKDAARSVRRRIDEAVLSASEEQTSRKGKACE